MTFAMFTGGHDYRLGDVEKMYLWLRRYENGAGRAAHRGTYALERMNDDPAILSTEKATD